MKKLTSVSPSQVNSYRSCPRQWFWGSVLYDRDPDRRSNVLGTAVHKALEIYQSTGEVLPIVRERATYLDKPGEPDAYEDFETLAFVQAAIDHLPPPATSDHWKQFPPEAGNGVMVEQQGQMSTYPDGPIWNQYIDHIHCPPGNVGEVTDFKTRSAFRYNKTPEELANDTQLMSNGRWVFQQSDYELLNLRHLNFLTRGRVKVVPVVTQVSRAQVEDFWVNDTLPTVREMEAHAAIATDPLSLPPNTDSCDKYGGCRRKSSCFGEPKLITLGGLFKMATPGSSVLDGLLAGAGVKTAVAPAAAQTPPASAPVVGTVVPAAAGSSFLGSILGTAPAVGTVVPAAPAAAPVAPAAPISSGLVAKSLADLLGGAKAPEPAPAPAVVPAPVVVPPSAFQAAAVAAGYPVNFAPTGGITPPDAPPATSTPEEVAEANKGNTTQPEEEDEESQETGTAPTLDATQGPETGADGKTRRKRRTKAEMAAARAAEATATVVQTPEVQAAIKSVASLIDTVVADHADKVTPQTLSGLLGNLNGTGAGTITVMTSGDFVPETKTPDVVTPGPQPAPVDPVVEQIKARLNTPDATMACPVKYLFIDCLPGKGWPEEHAPRDLREFWHAFATNAAANAKVADYRFVKYESKGYLGASIRAMLRGLPSSIYVDSAIPDVQEFLTAVVPYAEMVFRGR